MTGAMYASIAGLKTHMQDLNVIGNNIANINTKGYKAGRSVFRSALYTSLSAGREGTAVVGSKNPSQIGYGANLASVSIDMSTANYSPGKPTDCMIDGEGFFLLGDKETGNGVDPKNPNTLKSFTLTRVGDFEPKSDGYLANEAGQVVYGFLVVGEVDGEPIYSDQLVPIRMPYQDSEGNILWPSLKYVDEKGNILDEEAGGGGGGGTEDATSLRLMDTEYEPQAAGATGDRKKCVRAKLTNVSISQGTGVITGINEKGEEKVIGAIALGKVDNPNGVTQINSTNYKCQQGAGELSINMCGGLAKSVYVQHSAAALPNQGAEGEGEDYSLPKDRKEQPDSAGITLGMTYVNYSQVYGTEDGAADGEAINLPHGSKVFDTGSSTTVIPGGLESSKTDLATEISNMITTQRGYQANTRIITVTDSMLEELVNMKR